MKSYILLFGIVQQDLFYMLAQTIRSYLRKALWLQGGMGSCHELSAICYG